MSGSPKPLLKAHSRVLPSMSVNMKVTVPSGSFDAMSPLRANIGEIGITPMAVRRRRSQPTEGSRAAITGRRCSGRELY